MLLYRIVRFKGVLVLLGCVDLIALYKIIDSFFQGSHFLIILFILFGWIPRKTRRVHLVMVLLTAFSWFFLGIWYGWGYCFWTDWHWKVQNKLGVQNLPDSYIKYLLDSITGLNLSTTLVDSATAVCFLLCALASLYVNFRTRS